MTNRPKFTKKEVKIIYSRKKILMEKDIAGIVGKN